MEANREQSERCVEIGAKYLREGNRPQALKFFYKAQKLHPSSRVSELIAKAEGSSTAAGGNKKTEQQNGSAASSDYGAFDQYEEQQQQQENHSGPRNRFHGSRSQPNFEAEDGGGGGTPRKKSGAGNAADADEQQHDTNDKSSKKSDKRDRSSSRPGRGRTRTGSVSGGGGAHRTASTPQLGVDYTQEQYDAVQRIRLCKDYYEILNVKKEACDEDELKRRYRKLALKLHPDKNSSPGAAEAFKAVGNAYAVLSDPSKRQRYDMYGGVDETSMQQHSGRTHRHRHGDAFYEYDYSRGFEADVTAEEIFNMFFGGGFPSGDLRRRRAHHFYHQASGGAAAAGDENRTENSFGVILQLMPILILVFLSIASQLFISEPPFSLHRTNKYTEQRTTRDMQVVYFVKPDFMKDYQGSVNRVEKQVEEEFINNLRGNCFRERSHKETMMWRARTYGDAGMYEKAQSMRTPSCDKLNDLYT